MERPRSIFGPLLLSATGAIWLLVSSGRVPAANLWALTHVWPYVLIAAGIGVILRPYWRYVTVVLDVLIIGGVLLVIFYAPQLGWANPSLVYTVGNNDFSMGPAEAGSGNVISETRKVSGFDEVEISYPAEVFISQGNTESVKIEAEDNLMPGLKTEVRSGKLHIFYEKTGEKHVNPTKLPKITIIVQQLTELQFDSAGELTVEGVKTDDLRVSVSGAGNLDLTDITTQNLSVDLSGAGSMNASGKADDLRVNISGFGSFEGEDLHTQTASVSLSCAGSATLWVDDHLDAEISGAGSINYYGAADVTKQVNGLGSVSHLGNK